jgi:hypothetical protein
METRCASTCVSQAQKGEAPELTSGAEVLDRSAAGVSCAQSTGDELRSRTRQSEHGAEMD